MKRASILFCLLMLAAFFLSALSESTAGSLVEKKTAGGIPYVTGGVGLDERQEMTKMQRAFNLKLIFAAPEGNYLADVEVTISKPKGTPLLKVMAEGPWFFAELPDGEYEVSASLGGEKKTQMVKAGKSLHTVTFHWNAM